MPVEGIPAGQVLVEFLGGPHDGDSVKWPGWPPHEILVPRDDRDGRVALYRLADYTTPDRKRIAATYQGDRWT